MTSPIILKPHQITKLETKFTQQEIGDIFGVDERTVRNWKKENTSKGKRGRKNKMSWKSLVALLLHLYSENRNLTQQEMADYISQQIGQKISRYAVIRILKKYNITYKKLTYHYTQLDGEKAKAFNEEIKPLLTEYPFIAVDECSFYPNLDPRFGYSLQGKRAISKRPGHKGKHYTLLFAISNLKENGVVHWKLVKGKVNWKVFYDFLEEINPIGDKKNILLMDNAKIHTAPKKREKAGLPSVEEQMAKKNIEVRFITPYAPMLNATELAFCLLRQQTEKKRSRSYEEMRLAIEKVADLLNTKDLNKYFEHCLNYDFGKSCRGLEESKDANHSVWEIFSLKRGNQPIEY
jgi:transposase